MHGGSRFICPGEALIRRAAANNHRVMLEGTTSPCFKRHFFSSLQIFDAAVVVLAVVVGAEECLGGRKRRRPAFNVDRELGMFMLVDCTASLSLRWRGLPGF